MKEYTVTINGLEHTMLLEEEEQKRRFPKAKATVNKEAEAVPEHQAAADADKSEAESKEADKPANKSGTAANK